MKLLCNMLAVLLLAGTVLADANAVTCAKGVVREGCVSGGGEAMVVRKPMAAPLEVAPKPVAAPVVVAPRPVAVPAPKCVWVEGRKVCR